jgi:ABC-type polysaccharide/polyol phosphate transport system ATPase subunit/glycosyltransferase involved in cell wall biosynthesis
MTLQLLREWPPGYGGVERVAHELAVHWHQQGQPATVFSLVGPPDVRDLADPLPVPYWRALLPRLALGRLLLPLPSLSLWRLLSSPEPLHAHLPCPGVLLLVVLARLLRPRRPISVHWHAFLQVEATPAGLLIGLYQHVALAVVKRLPRVITTSPVLVAELVRCGCRPDRLQALPCCLAAEQEAAALALPFRSAAPATAAEPFQVLFIGRLDSYKRVDWLLAALASLRTPWRLDVVGDGPRRHQLELLAQGKPVKFWGRLDEVAKLERLAAAQVLVLPADRCNEAFGIVQLEAMAAGIPALAFRLPRSGMAWVSQLPGLTWSGAPADLATVLQRLAAEPAWRAVLGRQARDRYRQLFARQLWQRHLMGDQCGVGVSLAKSNARLAARLRQPLPSTPFAGDASPPVSTERPLVLAMRHVRLDIPVLTTETRSLKSTLMRSVTGGKLRRRGGGAVITALQNVNCTVREGERVALIGHNGAGKSTFLRLISGIYQHSSGHFEARVRVFPMIHKSFITSPELSGLQAIKAHYLLVNGNLRGFEPFCADVVEFSGLGDFVHLPVKTYSQGMAARLLFAVLTAGSHDCLAMDEGFGAGDSSFYDKAQQRLHTFLATTGTLLLASHSDELLRRFCQRGLVFEEGQIVFDGPLDAALAFYHQS